MDFSSEYISVGCNRFSNACDVSRPLSNGNGPAQAEDLVAFAAGKFVALWDTSSYQGIYTTLVGHTAPITTLKSFPPKEGLAAAFLTGDEEGTVKLWTSDLSDGVTFTCVKTLKEVHAGSISSLATFAIEAQRDQDELFVSGGSDGAVRVWKWNRQGPSSSPGDAAVELLQTIDLDGRLPLDLALAYLPGSDSLILAVAPTNRRLLIYTSPTPSSSFTRSLALDGHEDWIRCLTFTTFASRTDTESSTSNDLMLASGSQDGYTRLWRVSRLIESVEVQGYKLEESVPVQGQDETGLNDEMLDEFERKMTGDVSGGSTKSGQKQLSTKAHIVKIHNGEHLEEFGINLEALLIGHEGWITNLHWSPPSFNKHQTSPQTPQLLSTSSDNSMIIWSPEEESSVWYAKHRFGEMSGKGLGLFGALWTVKPNGEGAMEVGVVANGWNGGFHRWTTRAGQALDEEEYSPAWAVTGHALAVKDLTWDPKSEYLISVSTDQTTRIHAPCQPRAHPNDDPRWGEVGRPQIHGYDLTCVAAIDRTRFISGADEKVIRVFDAPRGFVSSLNALGVTSDDLHAESRSVGASVPPLGLSNRALTKVVDPSASTESQGFNQEHISISDELSELPTEAILSQSTLWPEIEKLYGHGYELITASSSPSGKLIATACKATTADHAVIRLYDTTTWKQFGSPLPGHTLTITQIAFSHDERYILSCSRDRTWRMFKRTEHGDDYEPVAAEKPHARIIWDCTWSPDDSYFITASRDKTVKFWAASDDGQGWKLLQTLKGKEPVTAVAIRKEKGANTDLLAIGFETGAMEIHRISDSGSLSALVQVVPPRLAHVDQVQRLAWSEEGPNLRLASCSEDRSVKVLSVRFNSHTSTSILPGTLSNGKATTRLTLDEYKRYGRQMILPGFGLPGQLKLKEASVAVVGAGGLGCPALQYLAGAGVGKISIFDFDKVEDSNLHRQILHATERVGWFKAESAKVAMEALNPHISVTAVTSPVLPETALQLLNGFLLILDCTDRAQTRYLISDAAVRLGVPLVSGAAIGHSGQWAIYGGYRTKESGEVEKRGCYRCIWPKPVITGSRPGAGTCEEEGVWGPVTGVVGTQMAADAIKLIVGMQDQEPRLHLMSLDPSNTPFRSIKIRGASVKCVACGPSATITDDLSAVGYDALCGVTEEGSSSAAAVDRLTAQQLQAELQSGSPPLLVDVREPTEFGICSLPGVTNIPIDDFMNDPLRSIQSLTTANKDVVFVCRRGNDSQLTAAALSAAVEAEGSWRVRDLMGGLRAWSSEVDADFPVY